ncbi:sensor histidine kinase [Clostridium sp. 'White wine YQ']|uniref:sensor histidine kinase n=1 Tax=Clostridium sp. 'White wine YQ' TaxID=3027474 RepID=UPI0023653256|nr:HAMP domain-containing sensor histidine kinase [Clostridium sp. 'White wine YQ']MDD7795323.1 HAMP domain-containing sensor histidine kinase [Clostridium sp. 'White wine YQ']
MSNRNEYNDNFDRWNKHVREVRRRHIEKHRLEREFQRKIHELYRGRNDFQWYHRHIKLTRPLIIIFNLFICYILFRNFGMKSIGITVATIIGLGGIMQLLFLVSLEKRILKPISRLKTGVEEIAKGNYEVYVDSDASNEVNVLIDSFNKMAKKLQDGERLKQEYEENRKLLIANISHDLKTPITSIQGYIETMTDRNDLPKETIEKYHQIIYSNAGYMNKLIDDLFLFSKLDMQKLDLQLESINVNAFMEDLMGEFGFELEERNIDFTYRDEIQDKYYVNIDRKRIHQVFKNIIGNSVKYASENNLKINVKLYGNKEFVFIDILDNGEGIPEDKLPYIFDRFYRVDYARTKDLMSTGLGLAIAKELVEAHGGEITASSEKGVGTCFTIKLPIKTN